MHAPISLNFIFFFTIFIFNNYLVNLIFVIEFLINKFVKEAKKP